MVACGIVLFFDLWARSLENHGYLRYAEIAREMIRSGEWVVPHFNGAIFIDKPPLLFWLIAIPSSLYGAVTPLLARLPSFFAAWLTVVVVFVWAKKVYGTIHSGLVAGGVLLSSYQFFFQARLAKTDIVLCFFILFSLYLFYLGYYAVHERRMLYHGLSFLSMGLGILTKGPAGALPFLVILAFLIKERQLRRLVSKEFMLGYGVLAVIILSWSLLFVDRVGFEQAVSLIQANRILTRKARFYFYFVEIWGEFFPWSVLLPFLLIAIWKQRTVRWRSGASFFILWVVVLLLFLTLFKYRASRYLLPILPALALLIGGVWQKKVRILLVFCFLAVTLWHGVEVNWILKDRFYSPGMVLSEKLGPLVERSTLSGYRLDLATIEEVNFYLDRVIPILENVESPPKEGWVLMPQVAYEEIRNRVSDRLRVVQDFDYKRGKVVLISLRALP